MCSVMILMRKWLALAWALLAIQAPVSAQAPDGIIVGQVVDADSGRGVPETIVTLTGSGASTSPLIPAPAGRRVLSDPNGMFVFRQVAPGRYGVTAAKPGYATGTYGRLVPRGVGGTFEFRQSEKLTDVRVLMWKQSSITGRVTDEAGEAVVGAEVRVQRAQPNAGRVGLAIMVGAVTDDRGIYRVSALDPGRYIVSVPSTSTTLPVAMMDTYARSTGQSRVEMQQALFAAAPTMVSASTAANLQIGEHLVQMQRRLPTAPPPSTGSSFLVYPRVYFAAARQAAEASAITLRSGEARGGVDIQLVAIPSRRVTGRVESAAGPVGTAAVVLLQNGPDGEPVGSFADAVASTVSDPSGAFTFLGVPPGQYTLVATKMPQMYVRPDPANGLLPGGVVSRAGEAATATPRPSQLAIQKVAVISDIVDLRVTMTSGFMMSGRLVYEDKAAQTTRPPTVFLESTAEWLQTLEVFEGQGAGDGSFVLPAMPGVRYQLTAIVGSGRYVKSVMVNGRDVSDFPFVIDQDLKDVVVNISSRGARVNGTVRDDKGRPDPTAGVIIFPVDPRGWVELSAYPRRLRDVRASSDGSYFVADLPAGEYLVAAAPQAAFDWSLPNFFERFRSVATRVTLAEGEGRLLDLRISQVK